jgi:regulator of protease activity HflC (stomatin/prohibitin superfamily)
MQVFEERPVRALNGFFMLFVGIALVLSAGWLLIDSFTGPSADGVPSVTLLSSGFERFLSVIFAIAGLLTFGGLFILRPNEAAALTFFGRYVGVCRDNGFNWVNPFYNASGRVSLRRNNFLSPTMKVNDLNGSPIEIAAAVQWRVRDVAQNAFGVDNFDVFLRASTESALRDVTSVHPYDTDHEADLRQAGSAGAQQAGQAKDSSSGAQNGQNAPHVVALRGHLDEIAKALVASLQTRLAPTGVVVEGASITHLAYAPEIAASMLRRQQASAMLAARKATTAGAALISVETLKTLESKDLKFTDAQKAALVSSLLITLCSEKEATPIISLADARDPNA